MCNVSGQLKNKRWNNFVSNLNNYFSNVIKDIGIRVSWQESRNSVQWTQEFNLLSLDKPIKGQAYRSLEFNKDNDYCDAIVSQICQQLGFASNLLGIRHDLTLWIDPYEITIRLVI